MFQYNEVKNPIFKYSVLAVGGVTILGIVWLFIQFYEAFNIGSGGSNYKVINSTTSPDNNYVATSYVMMGGGAAGWCYKLVKIRRSSEASASDNEVFRARCSSKLEVKWVNENNLNIAYSEESLFESKAEWNEVRISHSLIASNK